MKRVCAFVDVSNIYYCLGKKFENQRLDYAKYLKTIKDLGALHFANAYGAQIDNEAERFIHLLEQLGYTPKYKSPKSYSNTVDASKFRRKADWDVGIAIDIVKTIARMDVLVLGTADGDLAPAVEWARDQGVEVLVFACGISRELKNVASRWVEITEEYLNVGDPIDKEP